MIDEQQAHIGRTVAPLLAVLGQVIDADAPAMLALERTDRPRFERWHGLVNWYRDTLRLLRMPPAVEPRVSALRLLDQAREDVSLWSVDRTDAWLANLRAAILAIPGVDGVPVPLSPSHRAPDLDREANPLSESEVRARYAALVAHMAATGDDALKDLLRQYLTENDLLAETARRLTEQRDTARAALVPGPDDVANLDGCIMMCESLKEKLVPFGARADGWDSLLATLRGVQATFARPRPT